MKMRDSTEILKMRIPGDGSVPEDRRDDGTAMALTIAAGRPKHVSAAPRAADKAKALETLGHAKLHKGLDGAKLAELQSHMKQIIPSKTQVAEKGGGVGGYLRAWRELNG
jgi:hypothetical protein